MMDAFEQYYNNLVIDNRKIDVSETS